MMQTVEFASESCPGATVVVEVSGEDRLTERAGRGDATIAKAGATFEAALERARPVIEAIITKIRSISLTPDETAVEFGLKMSASTGVVVAGSSAEANFKLSLKWKGKAAGGQDGA